MYTMSHMLATKKLIAVDLFCGCGGISAGLRLAGFSILAGSYIESNYICTFRHNFPEAQAITDDLSKLSPALLMDRLEIKPGQLDFLAGGPPCQGFSKNVPRKNRALYLPNNLLVRTFIEYVEALQPKLVLMENVAEMKNGFDQAYTQQILNRLSSDGYTVSYRVLNAADYGVPQRRRRAFFLAHRLHSALDFPSPTHAKAPNAEEERDFSFPCMKEESHVTVWRQLVDLPSVSHDDKRKEYIYGCDPFSEYQRIMRKGRTKVINHTPRALQATQYERLASIQPGEGIKQLPDHLRPKSGYSGAYGRLTKDMVAPTITRWVFHPGSGRFGHPIDVRVISIREAARLQGFSDDFEFVGTYTQQAGQVGNAVPPLLIQKIARAMLDQIGYAGGTGVFREFSSLRFVGIHRSDVQHGYASY